MRNTQSGSALLLVILVSSILIATITALWRSTMFMSDIAYLRQRSYEGIYSTHAFMYMIITLCAQQYDRCYTLAHGEESLVLECAAWPMGHDTCHVCAYAKREDQYLAVRVEMLRDTHVLHTVSCALVRDHDDEHDQPSVRIEQWCEIRG